MLQALVRLEHALIARKLVASIAWRVSMFSRALVLAVAASLMISAAAFAHHGWGSYDAGKMFTIRSPVENLKWENPHVHIDVRHQGAIWEAVLAPPFRMDTRGLKPEILKPGAMVTVEGYPSTKVEREMRAERITVDGKIFELR
jgi:hypothetical protein